MAQIAQLEFKFDIKSSAEGFYQIFKCKPYIFPKLCPNLIKDCQLINGNWDSVGSVRKWIYVSGGNSSEFHTEKILAIDEKNKSVTCEMLEGGFTKLYKSYKYTVQALDKAEGGCTVKSAIEYEKQSEDVPPPNMYAEMGCVIYKDIDTYLINN
ncbi:Major latex protein domain containing protein [Trema orientale]|uniref:Major latex protein domain containing protein n=1 Tax=Trema orientale TaxID=63057 RepID=A0A2P5EQ80_TREOI|nr:Major latex protein domain containing protein [Trema orientale]